MTRLKGNNGATLPHSHRARFQAKMRPRVRRVRAGPYGRRKRLRSAKGSRVMSCHECGPGIVSRDVMHEEAQNQSQGHANIADAPIHATTPDAAAFEAHRPLLFSIAYRMLGRASEAEDVVQDAYLRYAASAPTDVRSLKAWLGTVVTRLCLDRLKSASAQREHYVGPWLPEPVIEADREPSLARAVEQRESTTLAFLVLLESLTPQERAVFVLREAFDYEYAEIAEILDLSPANCRQIYHRAKSRLREQRPRFHASREHHRKLVESFTQAMQHGDASTLESILAQDVVFTADGGGKIAAVTRPVEGREAVVKLLMGLVRQLDVLNEKSGADERYAMTIDRVNGLTAMLAWRGTALETVFTFVEGGDQGITAIDVIRNPDKLAYLKRELTTRAVS
jgi:RNA polymerase sigma-70 factor, ECF subfamily